MKHITIAIGDIPLLAPDITERQMDALRQTIHRAKGKGVIWRTENNPEDKRSRLIIYGSIPPEFIALHNLPTQAEVTSILAEIKAVKRQELNRAQAEGVDHALCSLMARKMEEAQLKHVSYYFGFYPGKPETARSLAREHALRLAVVLLNEAKTAPKTKLHRAYLALSDAGAKTITNYIRFSEDIKQWAADGVDLVHKLKGCAQEGKQKFTAAHKAIVEELAKHPNQYYCPAITEQLNIYCRKNGMAEVGVKTVSNYLHSPEVHNRLLFFRNKEQFNKKVKATTRRKRAFHPGDLYYMDGSPLQIACLNRAGDKVIRPTLFVVMDQCSGEIVGFSFTDGGEDKLVWLAAMKMACTLKMALPAEWVYDNASATATEEFKSLKSGLERMGCQLNPAKKGNPQAKANVERWFDLFQNMYQRLVDGFIGEGIRSRREAGRIDAEWLQKVKKVNGHYSYETMIELITRLIAAYNQKPTPRRAAPASVFIETPKPNAIQVSTEQLATLYWKHKTYTVRNGEIRMQVRHTEYFFEVYEHAQQLALAGQQVRVYYDETDLSQVHLFSLAGDYIAELRQKVLFAAARVNQQAGDVEQIIKQSSHNKAIETAAKKQSGKVAAALPQDATYSLLNPLQSLKDEFNNAETDLLLNYVRDNQNINPGKVAEYAPVAADGVHYPDATAPDYSKKYIQPGTLEIVGQQAR